MTTLLLQTCNLERSIVSQQIQQETVQVMDCLLIVIVADGSQFVGCFHNFA